jgi:hypothetical protein
MDGVVQRRSVTFEALRIGLQTDPRSRRQARGTGGTKVRKQQWPWDPLVPEDVVGQGLTGNSRSKGTKAARP